jgi:transposase
MRDARSFDRILLYRGSVDFRKWLCGLAQVVEHELSENLVDATTLFVFVSRDRRTVKCLYWNKTGLALWTSKLESERFLIGRSREGKVWITPQQLEWILSGIDYTKVQAHKEILVKKIT